MSLQPAAVTFTVLRPIWQRWWFLALAISVIVLAAYSAYNYRVVRLLEVANMRTRIASDLHDDIGANLTKISILSEVARQQAGNGEGSTDSPLASIARISRESVTSMSDIVWAVNPGRDSLVDLIRRMRLHAEESCLYRGIELSFQAPQGEHAFRVGVDKRRDLFLIFKEAVSNAVRHSGCSRLEVTLALEKGVVALTISDNGSGFDSGVESEANGLLSMQRRAEALGAKLKIESHVGQGTSIRVTVPLAAKKVIYKP